MSGFKGLVDLRAGSDVVGNAKRSSFAVLNEYIHASGLYEMVDNIRGQRSATFPDSRRVFFSDTNDELRGICSGRVAPSENYGGAFEQRHSRNNYQDGGGHTQDPRPQVTGGTPDEARMSGTDAPMPRPRPPASGLQQQRVDTMAVAVWLGLGA